MKASSSDAWRATSSYSVIWCRAAGLDLDPAAGSGIHEIADAGLVVARPGSAHLHRARRISQKPAGPAPTPGALLRAPPRPSRLPLDAEPGYSEGGGPGSAAAVHDRGRSRPHLLPANLAHADLVFPRQEIFLAEMTGGRGGNPAAATRVNCESADLISAAGLARAPGPTRSASPSWLARRLRRWSVRERIPSPGRPGR